MRLVDRRAARTRGLACVVAIMLALGPAVAAVRAQEAAPTGNTAVIAAGGETVLLREQPGYEAVALAPLADGSPLEVTGEPVISGDGSSWLPVVTAGQSGYVPTGYVTAAPVPSEPAPAAAPTAPPADAAAPPSGNAESAPLAAPGGTTAATATDVNLRSGPSPDAAVLVVLPPGTAVSVDGEARNGFLPVTGWGVSGWVAAELVTEGATTPAPASGPDPVALPVPEAVPEPSTASSAPTTTSAVAEPVTRAPEPSSDVPAATRGESTGIVWPVTGGEWEVVQGYNTGTHTNRSDFAQYKYSLDWARADGDTAGQPVYAPVSGTIAWTDRGSGGLLIDVGNGYGVALFHVTLDGGLGRSGSVERGQRIGQVSGPGGDGYMSMAHFQITVWRLAGRGHEAVPFVGANAIAGQEFPDSGAANQHMGARITP